MLRSTAAGSGDRERRGQPCANWCCRRGNTKWQMLSCEEDDSGSGGCKGRRDCEHDNYIATAGRVAYGHGPCQAPRLQHRRTHMQPARGDDDSGQALRLQSTGRRPNWTRRLIEATRNTHTHRSGARSAEDAWTDCIAANSDCGCRGKWEEEVGGWAVRI